MMTIYQLKILHLLTDLKKYISENNIDKTWHQIEEVKKVIPNLKEE